MNANMYCLVPTNEKSTMAMLISAGTRVHINHKFIVRHC